jgi:16S rRNA (uracil1498-N3)-methyltransferase
VLRLGPGDVVLAADGAGRDYTVRIETLGPAAEGTVLGVARRAVESPLAVTLVQGIPKGERMETIVRAATELGAARIVPVVVERTVVTLEPSRWRERARRWQRVAKEAAKQSGRAVVPDVVAPAPFAAWLAAAGPVDLALCLWEGERRPLGDVLASIATPPASAAIIVGPEGGLARAEVEQARDRGFVTVGLGPRILRTETAGPAVLAIVQSRFGDLGRTGNEAPAGRG